MLSIPDMQTESRFGAEEKAPWRPLSLCLIESEQEWEPLLYSSLYFFLHLYENDQE